ncbi:MAG: metalloregulator ArsR/SmtB family transcription factor [Armatimonadetes bacterium]|nr:metalloregulator ArsR/SmtB family transcription factor [Armatimonadota bacterium]
MPRDPTQTVTELPEETPWPADLAAELVAVYKALADATRLRLVGLLVERPRHVDELAAALGVSAPTVSHHLFRLKAADLVRTERDGPFVYYSLNLQRLHGLSNRLLPSVALPKDERGRTLATFFDGDRLLRLPSSQRRRHWVLEAVAARFQAGKTYREREVNTLLRPIYDDVASLRRALVDHGLLQRDEDRYRLAGGVKEDARDG